MGIYLIFGKFGKKCGVGQLPLSGALKPPVRQLRNGFSNSAQNLDSGTIFKPFGHDGWLKVTISWTNILEGNSFHILEPL